MIVVKRSIARDHKHRRKLIVASGSATLFGIDTAQLGRELGLPAINIGLHGSLPLRKILGEAARAADPGDAIILALEPEYYCARGITAWWARNAIAWDHEAWRAWSLRERIEAMAALGPVALIEMAAAKAAAAAFPGLVDGRVAAFDDARILATFAIAPEPDRFAYSAYHLDALGNMRRIEGSRFHGRPRPVDEDTAICPDSLRVLREFVSRMHLQGVAVQFAHPPYVADGQAPMERIKIASRKFVTEISAVAPVLDARKDVLFDRALFFNTSLHLNAHGREIRTSRLAQAIQADRTLRLHLGIRREVR
jgi:hypothetical protein